MVIVSSMTFIDSLKIELTLKMHLKSEDVVRKIIFRYLSVPLTDGLWNIFMHTR